MADLTTLLAKFLEELYRGTFGVTTPALQLTLTQASIGVTSTDGLTLTNTTDAAAGAQQMSPRLHFHGEGWKTDATAASQTVDVINELLPVQGASAPTANLLWKYAVNGGAYSTILTLTSQGSLTLANDLTTTGQIFVGAAQPIEWTGRSKMYSGAGSPEGAITAGVGSTFHRTDGGAGTSFYVKESGAGSTGWVAK